MTARRTIPALALALLCGAHAPRACGAGADRATALEAMKKLPPGKAALVARIAGNEGTPQPERWHFLVSDPAQPAGFTEYVVAQGEIVASRNVSQFAESVTPSEAAGPGALGFDSSEAARIAQDYAFANGKIITRIDYLLKKEGADAAPVWHLTCLGDAGETLGSLSLTSSKGLVIASEGFEQAPGTASPPPLLPPDPDAVADAGLLAPEASPTPASSPKKKTASSSRRRSSSDDDDESSGASKTFRKVGGKLQKFFTGRDTISR